MSSYSNNFSSSKRSVDEYVSFQMQMIIFPAIFLWYHSFLPRTTCHKNSHISFSYFSIKLKSLYPQSIFFASIILNHLVPFYITSLRRMISPLWHKLESLHVLTEVKLFSQPRCNFSSEVIISPSSMPFLSRLGEYNASTFSHYELGKLVLVRLYHHLQLQAE